MLYVVLADGTTKELSAACGIERRDGEIIFVSDAGVEVTRYDESAVLMFGNTDRIALLVQPHFERLQGHHASVVRLLSWSGPKELTEVPGERSQSKAPGFLYGPTRFKQ